MRDEPTSEGSVRVDAPVRRVRGESLIAEIETILLGIDKTEIEDIEHGWWETSTGADFGAEKLAAIKAAIREHFKSA